MKLWLVVVKTDSMLGVPFSVYDIIEVVESDELNFSEDYNKLFAKYSIQMFNYAHIQIMIFHREPSGIPWKDK
jgi:hypothetical protein